jgi:glutamate-5-semialdehyde dehydrogenase
MTGNPNPELRAQVESEAAAAHAAAGFLTDDAVARALARAAELVAAGREAILEANAADVAAAGDSLDAGALDRLRLDGARVAALAEQLAQLAELPPLERAEDAWTLENGLHVESRRIPIGAVGANFEARPNVAVDVAGQLLKSLNTAVLRTGSAALRTVTTLVDETLRPALTETGLPAGAVGLVRSPNREGARILVSLPSLLPLVIVRGSGPTTAALTAEAAANGVRTLAHAEGGAILYVHAGADPAKAQALVESGLDRLGVCNRLNLLLVDRAAEGLLPNLRDVLARLGVVEREPPRIGHEWANDPDPEKVASVTLHIVDSLDEAVAIGNDETSGVGATIVTEDTEAATRFLETSRGTAALWNATTRFIDGFALTGAPETGVNVGRVPGPRGPVTYRDLWLRQFRVVGGGFEHR